MRFLRTPFGRTVLATVLAWGLWGLTVSRALPTDFGTIEWAVFYGISFLATAGTATIVGLIVRRRSEDPARATRRAVRQGVLIGLALTAALGLQSHRLLSWVNALFLIAMLTVLEFFWVSVQRRPGNVGDMESADPS